MDRQRAEGRRCRLVTRRDERAEKMRQGTIELRSLRRKSRGEKRRGLETKRVEGEQRRGYS